MIDMLNKRGVLRAVDTCPAAIRSSLEELLRDTTHHCPRDEFFKSMNSVSLKCVVYLFRAIIARIRGRRASAKAADFMSVVNVLIASAQTV